MKIGHAILSAIAATLSLAAVTCSLAAAQATAKLGTGLTAGYHFTRTNALPLRPIDLSPFTGKYSTEILASPTTGLQAEIVMFTRLKPGAAKRGLYTLPADHTLLVMKGKLNLQIGTDEFVLEPNSLALIHSAVPSQIWNAGSEEVQVLETVAPIASSNLVYLMRPAKPVKVENAAQYLWIAPPLSEMKKGVGHEGLNERVLASTDNGSRHILERLDDVMPGSGGPPTHQHEEDQLYLVTAGTMMVEYKGEKMPAGPNTLVVLPRGIKHANTNQGDVLESHITLLMPAQPGGGPRGVAPISLASKPVGESKK